MPAPALPSSSAIPARPSVENIAAACLFVAYAAAQLIQEVILAGAPPESELANAYTFALSPLDRFRAIFLYASFFGLLAGYAVVFRRLRASGWALVGLLWIALFLGLELVNRAVELVTLAEWQRAWLATASASVERGSLAARIHAIESLQRAAYLPLLAAHGLASLAFGLAARGRDRWSRWVRWGFALNFARASIRFGAMQLGLVLLAPVAAAIYLPLTLFHSLAVAAWLAFGRERGIEGD
jgi:hypothetical protein